jgi:hypothetical protein
MKKMTYNLTNLKKIAAALSAAGLSGNTLFLALSQVAHETGGFNDKKITTHNNPAGITWINKKTIQLNATKGNPLPEAPKYHYAKFATLKDWANDFIRIVGKKLRSATSPADYAAKLKAGKYYTDTVKNYSKALEGHFKKVTQGAQKEKGHKMPLSILLIIAVAIFLYKSRR